MSGLGDQLAEGVARAITSAYLQAMALAEVATAAAQAGVSERVIAKQTGHKSLPVLRGYIREGSLFTENAAAKVGL